MYPGASLDMFEKRIALPLPRIEPWIIQPMYWLAAVPGQGHAKLYVQFAVECETV
jgi:hypothetical protein